MESVTRSDGRRAFLNAEDQQVFKQLSEQLKALESRDESLFAEVRKELRDCTSDDERDACLQRLVHPYDALPSLTDPILSELWKCESDEQMDMCLLRRVDFWRTELEHDPILKDLDAAERFESFRKEYRTCNSITAKADCLRRLVGPYAIAAHSHRWVPDERD